MQALRVAIVAGAPLAQAGLARSIDESDRFELVAVAASMRALRLALVAQPSLQVDVAVVESTPDDIAEIATALGAGTAIVLLSDADPADLAPLVGAGAACLPSSAGDRAITAAIDAVAAGLVALRSDLFNEMLRRAATSDHPHRRQPVELVEPLTPRELQVLRLLAGGLANKHIAHDLGISEHTAKFHVGRILDKLDAATRAEAVAIGLRDRLIEVSD